MPQPGKDVVNLDSLHIMERRQVSEHVLSCVKRLNEAFPDPVDLTRVSSTVPTALIDKVLATLSEQELTSGPAERTQLTLAGYRALKAAAAADYKLAQWLSDGQNAVSAEDPHALMLELLRAHFHARRSAGPE